MALLLPDDWRQWSDIAYFDYNSATWKQLPAGLPHDARFFVDVDEKGHPVFLCDGDFSWHKDLVHWGPIKAHKGVLSPAPMVLRTKVGYFNNVPHSLYSTRQCTETVPSCPTCCALVADST